MAKRKLRPRQKESDDEAELLRPLKQFKKQNNSCLEIVKSISSFKRECDSFEDSDNSSVSEISDIAEDDIHYESFSCFLEAFSYYDGSDNGYRKFSGASQNVSKEDEFLMVDSKRRKSLEEVSYYNSSPYDGMLTEELDSKIRTIDVPSKLSQLVLLQHPTSLTLHGYLKVSVKIGDIYIFGYNVKEGETIEVFSTEGTGLKKVVTSRSNHKLEIEALRRDLEKLTSLENIDINGFIDDIGSSSIVLILEELLLPAPLQFLQLYYPTALQTRWIRSETSEKEKNCKLCSTEQSYTIDVSGDFKMLSTQINEVISKSDRADYGPCILVRGEKNMGKSTLIRYLMNSSLNKVKKVYFLDTDPGQTEFTPPGVISLFKVTKPLLGPPFAHQKQPLEMIFIGSITPATSPKLYEASIVNLMQSFKKLKGKPTLFVNTMGWVQGVGQLCLQNVKKAVNPTIEIELVAPNSNSALTREIDENEITIFKVPSKAPSRESKAPSYSPVELRNFNIMAYFGQCQKSFLPVSLINSFHPVCVSWDKVALYVLGKKVPAQRLSQALHCSIVALCKVKLSHVLESNNPDLPRTLYDEPICKCLGFGLVRASDETNHIFYIVTPLNLDQLKDVNALVKGNIMVPDEIFLKQTVENVPLLFTDHSQVAKTTGLKAVPKRAFRNTLTPNQTR